MTLSAPMGVPRPASGNQKDTKDQEKTGYQAREMAEKAAKEKRDKENQVALWERDLVSERAELAAQETAHNRLLQEINKIKSQPISSATASGVSEISNLERQKEAKIAEDERKIKQIERQSEELDQTLEMRRSQVLAEKELEEREQTTHIQKIKEQIKNLTLELNKAEAEEKELQQEVLQLKNEKNKKGVLAHEHSDLKGIAQQRASRSAENKKNIEKLKNDIATLNQNFEAKRKTVEKAGMLEKNKLAANQQGLLKELTDKAVLAVRRMEEMKHRIRELEGRIQSLKK